MKMAEILLMYNIFSYQGNTNLNDFDISYYHSQND